MTLCIDTVPSTSLNLNLLLKPMWQIKAVNSLAVFGLIFAFIYILFEQACSG